MTIVPGPWSETAASEEDAVAALLARPDSVRSVHQPVVELGHGHCAGYSAVVRVAEWVGRESGPWFRAAAGAGLSGPLAGLALQACLRARATMPGDRFLAAEVSGRVLTADSVISVLNDEDDVGDLVLTVTGDLGPGSAEVIRRLRARGLRFAASCGAAGLDDLEAIAGWKPEVLRLPAQLVRGIDTDPLRQRIVALVVDLADDLNTGFYGADPVADHSGGTEPLPLDGLDDVTAELSLADSDSGSDPGSGSGSGGNGSHGGGVLAEDVETLAELAALRDLGVRWAQGWLVGRLRPGFSPPSLDLPALVAGLDRRDLDLRDELPGSYLGQVGTGA